MTWRELYRTDDLPQARAVATSVAAMEFDVRLCDARTGALLDEENDHGGPYVVETRASQWRDLIDVLPEIVDEQREFDEFIERWRQQTHRAHRRVLLILLVIVAFLGVFRLIEL